MQKNESYRIFGRRALLLAGGKTLLLSALAGRMYYLQVVEANRYALLADENRINLRLLAPPRGDIVDRFGVPMATNDQNYRVVLVAEQTPDLDRTLQALSLFVPIAADDRVRIRQERARNRAFVPIAVRDDLSWEQVAGIEVNAPDLPGTSIEVEQRRVYPFGGATAHILGYVAAVSEADQTETDPLLQLPGFRIGKSGIEKQYDKQLRGAAGTSQEEVNAVGRIIRELSRDEGKPGQKLVVTIDMGLQQFVQQRLASELSAAAVVLDVQTGDVLALGSTPTFDPSIFGRGLSGEEWRGLIGDPLRPLSNKALAGQYAPGSTFKMMVALAALDAGIDPSFGVSCHGVVSLGRARFHCWRRGGHGRLQMTEAIRHSCDVYFYELARRIGIDRIAVMARRFGLGSPTGIDVPGEQPGLIPDSAWKLATLGDKWHPGENLVAGIGQGYITATPLQLAVMAAQIGNGGKQIVPRLVRELQQPDGSSVELEPNLASLDIPPAHLTVVTKGMDQVVNHARGTAYRVRIEDPAMSMAGKTGTSQVRRITMSERQSGVRKNEDLPWAQRDHALFVAFAPVAAPRYAVSVVVEHGGGGSAVAGPIARDIMLETQVRDPARGVPPPPPIVSTLS